MYTEFEQDLILACKSHYGTNGVEKVIRDYIGYSENQEITIHSTYHFISELYIKMVENNHLKLYFLLKDKLAPTKIYDYNNRSLFNNTKYSLYDFPKIVCDHMMAEIQGVRVIGKDDKVLIELHEANEKFVKQEEVKC